MTKNTITVTDNKCKVVAVNPDEEFKRYVGRKIEAAIRSEILDFLQEVQVAFRKLEPGKEVKLSSKPIEVTIACGVDE